MKMTKERTRSGAMPNQPHSCFEDNGNLRFRKTSIDQSLALSEQKAE
jgi:hypothetical protein